MESDIIMIIWERLQIIYGEKQLLGKQSQRRWSSRQIFLFLMQEEICCGKWYETRYNEIVKEHENGDREVSYELTGKRSLTLDEDLAGLDEAFKMRLANLEGYITCQQTNKAFENADSSWYFRRNSPQNEVKTQDKAQMFDTKYQKTAVSIMEQAKEKFLVAFKSINYKQGTATSILSDIMKKCW